MYIFKKNEIGMSGLYIVFNKGSLYENKGHRGTHHLMEHLVIAQSYNQFLKIYFITVLM